MQSTAARNSGSSALPWIILALALLVVCIRGMFIDLMDIDASQYASIAMEMLQSGHWLQVHYHHADYLDKPPLLFWTAALSFAAFGLHDWAYRLPSLVAALAGVYATWRFCLLFYPRAAARNAAFMLASSLGMMLMTNDVRTDALLTGTTACAMWHIAAWLEPSSGSPSRRTVHLLLAGAFVGLAMLAKGPIGLVAPAFAVVTHLGLRRDWKPLLRGRWLPGIVVAGAVLIPMCWGLYHQFDLHPDKLVNGRHGVSGLRFFFWDQSFGRITGTSSWRNDTSPLFFAHTYLWVFLPWSLLFVAALGRRLRDIVRDRGRIAARDEAYSIGGFVLTFVALSLSQYKLPHYIFMTLPWAAILTARWLAARSPDGSGGRLPRVWWIGQFVVLAVLIVAMGWILTRVFPSANALLWIVPIIPLALMTSSSMRQPFPADASVLVQRSVLVMAALGFVLNFHFYPELLKYQGTSNLAHAAARTGIPAPRIASFGGAGDGLDFYSGATIPEIASPAEVRSTAAAIGTYWLYTDSVGRALLDSAGVSYADGLRYQQAPVSRLTTQFLDSRTRPATLAPVFLLRIPPALQQR